LIPRCISIRQPWAWLICSGIKPIENRTWETAYRGPILIHAGLKAEKRDPDLMKFLKAQGTEPPAELELGGIVGQANLVDVVKVSKSPWFFGPLGFVLANAKPLPFIPSKGQLGIYYPDKDLIAELRKKGIIK